MPYAPKNLKKWNRPPCYIGEQWPDFYGSGVGQHRDSPALDRANFLAMQNALRQADPDGEGEPTGWQVVREDHWAVGWVEWIAIHQSDARALKAADQIAERMEDYPIIDEELYSEIENDECAEVWQSMGSGDRLQYLRQHGRRDGAPGQFRRALAAVRGDWHAAGELLPCPSDLLC